MDDKNFNPFQSQKRGELQSSEPSLPNWGGQGASHPMTAAPTSHDTNRVKCCLICWRWAKFALPDSVKTEIPTLFGIQINFSDRRVPLGMCSSCKVGLYAFKKTKVNSKNLEMVHKTFDFS